MNMEQQHQLQLASAPLCSLYVLVLLYRMAEKLHVWCVLDYNRRWYTVYSSNVILVYERRKGGGEGERGMGKGEGAWRGREVRGG